ncbi:MAG: adenine nucleotide alpha hydrolase family protein [Actinomycetota bacterium]|nr:adenine nucleotide alpha hydrolase family protein [Actinomycetota bacterium]
MRCRSCRGPAVIEIRRHRAAFCTEHFLVMFRTQVEKAIRRFRMMGPDDRILVAVSGGKDSLALWDVLLGLGYDASGLYLGLGIGGYSDRSHDAVRNFADHRGVRLLTVDIEQEHGFDIPTAGQRGSRSTCAVCGLSKRYVFNRAALEGGFDVLATGHNLDDEAATLLGNTLRWQTEAIARQSPALPAHEGMVRKVKPLHRLSELETAAYAFLRGIDYVVEECPLVAGNTQLRHKEAMNAIEHASPGTKAQFFLGYLERGAPLFRSEDRADLRSCEACSQPTTGRFCAFCRARAQILGERLRAGPEPSDRELAEELADEVLPAEIYDRAGR